MRDIGSTYEQNQQISDIEENEFRPKHREKRQVRKTKNVDYDDNLERK